MSKRAKRKKRHLKERAAAADDKRLIEGVIDVDSYEKEMAEREKSREAAAAAFKAPEKEPNPYYWGGPDGNYLLHRSGRQVAHIDDFPAFRQIRTALEPGKRDV